MKKLIPTKEIIKNLFLTLWAALILFFFNGLGTAGFVLALVLAEELPILHNLSGMTAIISILAVPLIVFAIPAIFLLKHWKPWLCLLPLQIAVYWAILYIQTAGDFAFGFVAGIIAIEAIIIGIKSLIRGYKNRKMKPPVNLPVLDEN